MSRRIATFEFLHDCRAAKTADEIGALLQAALAQCGISYVACASHVDPLKPPRGAVMMVNYPQAWLAHFSDSGFAHVDPIYWAAGWMPREFWWDTFFATIELGREQKRVLNEARECGIVGGMTIPIHSPGALPASCSVVPGPDGVDPLDIPDIQFMAINAHEEARLRNGGSVNVPPILSKRQRECLGLAALGKSDGVIGQILGISPRTVEHTIEEVRRKFGVSHRTQAVALSVVSRLVSLNELSD